MFLLALLGIVPMAQAATSATATTPEFRLSIKHDGVRASAGEETLRYSSLWDGGSNETAKVTIAQNGTALVENLTDEGDRAWSVTQNGTYNLTHTTYTNGAVAAVLNATFIVTGKDVPFPEGDVTVMGHIGKYDGEGHGITVTAPEGSTIRYARSAEGPYGANPSFTNVCGSTTIWCEVTKAGYIPYTNSATVVINKREVTLTSGSGARAYNGIALTNWTFTVSGDVFVGDEGVTCTYSGTQTIVGSSKNTFDYALKSGTSADNYTISKVEGDLEVTASEIVNPFDPDDPTKPVTPEVLAKANCVTNYDGDGHSIGVVKLLNPLIAANNPQVTYSLLQNGTYETQNPVFTNVVATSVWYRIAADNFKPFTTNALLTISPRAITKATMAAIADQTYTGSAITPVPTVSDERMLIGAAEPTNIITAADYEVSYADNVNVGTAKIILSGTNNYEGVVTNTFNITAAPIPFGPTVGITATGYTNAYDGAAHGVSVTAMGLKTTPTVQYKGSAAARWQNASPTYTDVCDTQVWWKVSAPNYSDAVGTIGLKITQAANEWTTTPAIECWTYGETAKTPVGAAKFGTVAFTYDPTPVGDAGDYTMTASVAGTANYTALSTDVSFTIAKKTIPGGGDEPGGGEVPPGGLSKYDVTVMYDGGEHTIDTNKIAEVFKTVVVGSFEMQYAVGNGTAWGSELPAWKDVVATSLWYRVTSPNYNDYTHQAKVTVTNRPVTVTSGTKLDFVYDGTAHTNSHIIISESGFVAGEGIATSNWATVTTVAEGEVANTFDFAEIEGTKLSNYDITVVTGKIAVVKGSLDPEDDPGKVDPGVDPSDPGQIEDPTIKFSPWDYVGMYDGAVHTVDTNAMRAAYAAVVGEGVSVQYSAGRGLPALPWVDAAPVFKDVVATSFWYKVSSPSYEDVIHPCKVIITPKTVTTNMFAYSDEGFIYDYEHTKVPDVILADTNEFGEVISTSNDYIRVIGARLASGEFPVTITGTNNYTGSAMMLCKPGKRTTDPPQIPSYGYTGKKQVAYVADDPRWTVVENDGGVTVGVYRVVLRLTNPTDFKWRGQSDDEADWVGEFRIVKSANRWRSSPGILDWTEGETPSEPKGRALFGDFKTAYRVRGTDVSTETMTKPLTAGLYTARFWVEEGDNWQSLSMSPPYKEYNFEIKPAEEEGETETTPVPVPKSWLAPYVDEYGDGNYELAAHATGANGYALWESYVAGLDPNDETSQFTAKITIGADGVPQVEWSPDLSDGNPPRVYTTLGKGNLGDENWTPVTDENRSKMKFFTVEVEMGE